MSNYLIRGAKIYGEEPQDILIVRGQIAAVGASTGASDDASNGGSDGGSDGGSTIGAEFKDVDDLIEVDASGLIALPGMVDMHTHLREPGREDAETVLTGTQAAARGGFTAVHAMANTAPVADTVAVVELVDRLGREAGWCQVRPVGAVTVGLAGERLADIGGMADSSAQVRMFSDDGMCVSDAQLMRRALEYVKAFDGFIAQHAQDPRLSENAQMNEGVVSGELGMIGWPSVAEEAIIARDVLLTEHTDSRLHVCHLSTAGSVEIIRAAKARGIKVSAEVTPHHLLLTEELVRSFNPVYKVNPPLRTDEDVSALRLAVAEGIIDVIGTDHAPHPDESKEREWMNAAMGMTGLETALSVVAAALVETGMISWRRFAEITSQTPARLTGLDNQGHDFEVGAEANIILVDPDARWSVDPKAMSTRGNNSPFAQMELPARVVHTFYRGHHVVADSQLATAVVSA